MGKIDNDLKILIRSDREQGLSVYDIATKRECSKTSVHNIVKKVKISKPQTTPLTRPDLSKGNIGEAARQMICARLLFNGINVYKPLNEDTVIDLLTSTQNGPIRKCQCKYIYPIKNGSHELLLCSIRKNGPGSKAVRHIYTKNEVDFILGYCLDDDSVYVIPYKDIIGKQRLILWILRNPSTHKNRFKHENYKNNFKLLKQPL